MDENGKVVVNLATGLEAPERVTVAFLVTGVAAAEGKQVTMFLTKEAVRLALAGVAEGVACTGWRLRRDRLQLLAIGGHHEEARSVERNRRSGGYGHVGRRDRVGRNPGRGRRHQRLLPEERRQPPGDRSRYG